MPQTDRLNNKSVSSHIPTHSPPLPAAVLLLIEPSKGKRRPDDRLPEEIVLDRPSIVIGALVGCGGSRCRSIIHRPHSKRGNTHRAEHQGRRAAGAGGRLAEHGQPPARAAAGGGGRGGEDRGPGMWKIGCASCMSCADGSNSCMHATSDHGAGLAERPLRQPRQGERAAAAKTIVCRPSLCT